MEHINIIVRILKSKELEESQEDAQSQKPTEYTASMYSIGSTTRHFASSTFYFPGAEWKAFVGVLHQEELRLRGNVSPISIIVNMGRKLFQALFPKNTASHTFYTNIMSECRQRQADVRLLLYIDPDELVSLPWELMHDSGDGRYLGLRNDPRVSIVRAPIRETCEVAAVQPVSPWRVLGMIAQPQELDLPPLEEAERERVRIAEALRSLRDRGLVEIEWVKPPTKTVLERKLNEKTWHVFHFIGHSGYDPDSNEGYILLEDERRREDRLMANQFGTLFADKRPVLVVLNSCESGRSSEDDQMSSLASHLAAYGVPAILTMQYKMPDEMGPIFSGALYEELGQQQHSISMSVTKARLKIQQTASAGPLHWGMPMLHMCAPDDVTFQFIPPRKTWKRRFLAIASCLLALLLVIGLAGTLLPDISVNPFYYCTDYSQYYAMGYDSLNFLVRSVPAPGLHVPFTQCNNLLGVSSGAFVFDTQGPDAADMQLAAQAYRSGDQAHLDNYLSQAVAAQNAEAAIYKADNDVLQGLSNPNQYNIVIVGGNFQPDNIGEMRDILQGTYLAQARYNRQSGHLPLMILLANAGNDANGATAVARGIVDFAQNHPNLLGVMGWPLSSYTLNAKKVLTQNHITMVSPTSTSSDIAHDPYFFRVVSSDTLQARAAANYIQQQASGNHSYKVAVFYDHDDDYNSSLGTNIADRLKMLAINTEEKSYRANCFMLINCQTLDAVLDNALQESSPPNLIYLAGYVKDGQHLLQLMQDKHAPQNIKVMGGDGLAVLNNYPPGQAGLDRLIVTTFASQDQVASSFISAYSGAFSPNNSSPRVDSDVILAYDAMNVLLQGYKMVGDAHAKPSLSCQLTCQIARQLGNMNAYPGLSGNISFNGHSSDPSNKLIVIAHVDTNIGQLHSDQSQLCSPGPDGSGTCKQVWPAAKTQ